MKTCPTCQEIYPDNCSLCPRDGAPLAAQATESEAQLAAGLSRRFRIVRRLGAGGVGTVFLAEQIGVGNRLVALKVLNRRLLDDPGFLLRFQNEAAFTGCVHHTNVVTIYESGQAEDGTPYIAMEFLEGETLRHALETRGALPVAECAEVLQQAARGLNAAHKQGVIHRDLKTENIFLTTGDEGELTVKIAGFGIAELRESAADTPTGTVLGTPACMSLEQVSGMKSDELDVCSDIYSLGIITYEMLTGCLPFHSDPAVGYLRRHLQDAAPPFHSVNPGLPPLPLVESVVMKALTTNRDQPYASALEFAREFTHAAQTPAPSDAVPANKVAEPLAIGQAEQERPPQKMDEREGLVGEEPEEKHRNAEIVKVAPQQQSRAIYVVLGLVGLAVIVGAIWLFWLGPERRHLAERNPTIEKSGLAARAAKANPKDGLKYVWIPPGTFMMGCSPGDKDCREDEKPSHRVAINKGFWLGQTDVTVGAYKRFVGSRSGTMPPAPDFNKSWANENMPIVNVSWEDAQAYCSWVGGRLPTEAEWEYAARGGSTEVRYGPLGEVAWYADNSGQQPLHSTQISENFIQQLMDNDNRLHEVGLKRANSFGLFDMLGNVSEWVSDWYDAHYYQNSPSEDPPGPASGQDRVLRGGWWSASPRYVRVSFRNGAFQPSARDEGVGFRCAGKVVGP